MSAAVGPIRAVFDTNVFLQALVNPHGPAGACIDFVRRSGVTLCLGNALMKEVADVFARPSLVAKFQFSHARTEAFLAEMRSTARWIDPVREIFQHALDPKDTKVVNLAIAADAHVITSRDHHLLDLRDATKPAGRDFLAHFAHIDVLTPEAMLVRLRTP